VIETMATTTTSPAGDAISGGRPGAPAHAHKQTPPAVWWALIGGLFLAFEIYVMVKWVTGPYFHTVPSGPTVVPNWMKAILISWQVIGIAVALGLIGWFLVRPWRRDGRVSFDGLLCVAALLVVWQDPLSSYFSHWYTYNAYLVNDGSWVKGIPGWMSSGSPGKMELEPILWTPFLYVYLFFGGAAFACWVMRKASAWRPSLGNLGLIACAMVAGMIVDFVAEGLLILPAGVYTYAGGHLALFSQTYHKYPLTEAPTVGGIIAGLGALRFFKDDQGRTMVERGVDALKLGSGRANVLRFLAVFGMINVLVLCCYNVPNAIIGAHSTAWPADLQKRSYLTDHICGPGTKLPCPGPSVPLSQPHSAYENRAGKLVFPKGVTPPKTVPYSR
jgi:hypothetical protein